MVKYKILGSFTDLIKDIILRDTALNKKYTLNHPRTKYTLDDILIDILIVCFYSVHNISATYVNKCLLLFFCQLMSCVYE